MPSKNLLANTEMNKKEVAVCFESSLSRRLEMTCGGYRYYNERVCIHLLIVFPGYIRDFALQKICLLAVGTPYIC